MSSNATNTLIAEFRALKVSFTMWGTKRALEDSKLVLAAETFGADAKFFGASKKLIDTKAPAYAKVTGIKSRIARAWHDTTLPYTEPGVRLIRENAVNGFAEYVTNARCELLDAVESLDSQYLSLRNVARTKLGSLYNESDYPMTLRGLFDVAWEFPNVTPPEYLRELNPAMFEQERQRMVSRFDEAVKLAEQMFAKEFSDVVSHLAERLTGVNPETGQPKQFKDSAVDNLKSFFEKFRTLSVRSNTQLDELVRQAQDLIGRVNASDLKADGGRTTGAQDVLRNHVRSNMQAISESLSGMICDKPRRRIIKPKMSVA